MKTAILTMSLLFSTSALSCDSSYIKLSIYSDDVDAILPVLEGEGAKASKKLLTSHQAAIECGADYVFVSKETKRRIDGNEFQPDTADIVESSEVRIKKLGNQNMKVRFRLDSTLALVPKEIDGIVKFSPKTREVNIDSMSVFRDGEYSPILSDGISIEIDLIDTAS